MNKKLPNYEFYVVDEMLYTGTQKDDKPNPANTGWHLDAIGLKDAWKYTKGSSDIIVAVVDGGIDVSHELLQGRIVKPYNICTQNSKHTPSEHGTHVAGLAVGSDSKYNKGASGVAPGCKLMPIQVFEGKRTTTFNIISGIMYAINNDADVINVSAGADLEGLSSQSPEQQREVANMFNIEAKLWEHIAKIANKKNTVLVFAAGNDSLLANIPPEHRTNSSISVAAVNRERKQTNLTNFSEGTNISAPGQDIYSSIPCGYNLTNGTSMAAPIVSGAIALMKSVKPNIKIDEILRVLQTTGEKIRGNVPPMVRVDCALAELNGDEWDSSRRDDNSDDLRAERDRLQREINEREQRISDLQKEIEKLRQEISERQRRLEEINAKLA
jgi:subtilisin family serine protease